MPMTRCCMSLFRQGAGSARSVVLGGPCIAKTCPPGIETALRLSAVQFRSFSASQGSQDPARRSIVVLGAGMCAPPAVEYLSRPRGSSEPALVTVVSGKAGEAMALRDALGRSNVQAATLSACPSSTADWRELTSLLGSADAVLSLLPATMHVPIARACIDIGIPFVSASYVSAEMEALDEAARAANVPLLCEMGLDPGMDHMSALALIAEVQSQGGVVTSFRSLCGGLPAPESADNPFRYKFSWNPAGVLTAAKNSACYLEGGTVVDVAGDQLLHSATPLHDSELGKVLRLEVLPNRNSLAYKAKYGLDSPALQTLYRGTLRYEGWSSLMAELTAMGLTESSHDVPSDVSSWPAMLEALGVRETGGSIGSGSAMAALKWLGAFSESAAISKDSPNAQAAFCELLQSKLAYAASERDMVLMEHQVVAEYPAASKRPAQLYSSSLFAYGTPGGDSAMSRTVGLASAIGVHCVLTQRSGRTSAADTAVPAGVLTPTLPCVYEYALPELADEGFVFREAVSDVAAGA